MPFVLTPLLSGLARWIRDADARARARETARQDRRALMSLDDRALQDMGLTRDEARYQTRQR